MTNEVPSARGRKLGDRRVKVVRPHATYFRYAGPNTLVAREAASQPRTRTGRTAARLRAVVFGRPLSIHEEIGERLSALTGLPIFASDNISSSAYATEEIMRVLAVAGAGTLVLTMPITIAIVLVLAIVVTSYRQTIAAYPNGGGSYIVASDNLGTLPGLTAAAALLTDYVLTVAVSVAAGVLALTSIVPELFGARVAIGVSIVVVIALVNLRGLRESGLVFSVPTYVYLVSIFGLLGIGLFRFATGTMPTYQPPADWLASAQAAQPLGLLLILRAFASGSVALTGVEAVSNGVPAFKPPETHNAQRVIVLMGMFFGLIFLGMSFLVGQLGILPDPTEQETVVSQLTRTFVGAGTPFHYLVQVSTAVLLVLAANTSFADFPRLSSILARDGFLPRVFQFRGDRLAFNGGIVVLASVSVLLIVAFGGSVDALIPLYTVGVFVAFTLSQAGMVRRWLRLRDGGWQRRAVINGVGALTTGVVAIEVGASKFALGAWVVLLLIPILITGMLFIRRQYRSTSLQLAVRPGVVFPGPRRSQRVVVPVPGLNRAVVQAVNVGRSIGHDVQAVLVSDDPAEAERVRSDWAKQLPWVPLTVVESPFRQLVAPMLAYLDVLDAAWPPGHDAAITFVVIPEFVARSWWERLLYNQSARRLREALLGRRRTVVVNVPYRREDADLNGHATNTSPTPPPPVAESASSVGEPPDPA